MLLAPVLPAVALAQPKTLPYAPTYQIKSGVTREELTRALQRGKFN